MHTLANAFELQYFNTKRKKKLCYQYKDFNHRCKGYTLLFFSMHKNCEFCMPEKTWKNFLTLQLIQLKISSSDINKNIFSICNLAISCSFADAREVTVASAWHRACTLGKTPVSLPIYYGLFAAPDMRQVPAKKKKGSRIINGEWQGKTVRACIGSHTFLIDGSWLLPTKRLFRSAANFDFHDNRPKMADLKSVMFTTHAREQKSDLTAHA